MTPIRIHDRALWCAALGFVALLLVGACSPTEQPVQPASVEPALHDDYFITKDNYKLPLRRFMPEGAPKAVIIALHGMNDYSNAFTGAGDYFKAQGLALYAYDQRGFGANGMRGIWGGNQNLMTDMAQLAALVKHEHPSAPVYVLGESMGGAVAINAMSAADLAEVDGVILSAPAVWGEDAMNGFYRASLWLMAHTFPASEFTGEDLEILASDNIAMLRALAMDPLVIKQTRVDAMYGIVGLMDDAYRNIEQVKKPVLVLYGANDEVIPADAVTGAIGRITAPYTVAYYPKGYHMLLRDLQGEVVLGDIVSWIEDRYKPLPSGSDMGWRDDMRLVYERNAHQAALQ